MLEQFIILLCFLALVWFAIGYSTKSTLYPQTTQQSQQQSQQTQTRTPENFTTNNTFPTPPIDNFSINNNNRKIRVKFRPEVEERTYSKKNGDIIGHDKIIGING